MACVQDAHALHPVALDPVANLSLPVNSTWFTDLEWMAYLSNYSSEGTPGSHGVRFNETATLELVRDNLESCREWDTVCQDPSQIFANGVNLVICSLYPNSTAMINNGSGYDAAVQVINSIIPTCLISYCALNPLCHSQFGNCMVGNLLTADGHLSGEGVGRCWLYMCPDPYLSVDQDIGGVGVSQSFKCLEHHLLTALDDRVISHAGIDCAFGHGSHRICPYSTIRKEDKPAWFTSI